METMNYEKPTFCEEVERFFFEKRGVNGRVSALDFQVLTQWEKVGVPIEMVKRVLDDGFAKNPLITTLRYFEKPMAEAMEQRAKAMVGASEHRVEMLEPVIDDRDSPVREFLKTYAEKIIALAGSVEERFFAEVTSIATQLRKVAAAPALPDPETLENELTEMEGRLLDVLCVSLSPGQKSQMTDEITAALKRFSGKMPADVLAQTTRNKLNEKTLELHRLPRLSVLFL